MNRERRARRMLALGVTAVAWLVLVLGHPSAPLHGDTTEDLLLARDCFERGICQTAGASTTVENVEQGALWLSLLAALLGAGLSASAIHLLTLLLAAIAIALVFGFVARRSLPVAAVAAWLLLLATLHGQALHVLWNPSLTPLPSALLLLVALDRTTHRSRIGWLPLGAALALTLETHPVAALVVPGTLLLAGFTVPRRLEAALAALLAGLCALGFYVLLSPAAAFGNVLVALDRAAWALLGGGALVLAASPALHGRVVALSARARSVLVCAALGLPALLVVVARGLLDPDGPTGPRYAAPAFPAIALLAAEFIGPQLTTVRRRVAVGLAGLLAFTPVLLEQARDRAYVADAELKQAHVEAAMQVLQQRGLRTDDVLRRMSGPQCLGIVGETMALGLPLGDSGRDERSDLVLVPGRGVSVDALNRGRWRRLPHRGQPALLGELHSWVDRRHVAACALANEEFCIERRLDEGLYPLMSPSPPHLLSLLRRPSILIEEAPREPITRVRYTMQVRIPPHSGTRDVHLARELAYACRDFAFESTEGLRVGTPLPAPTVRLESTDRWQRGRLVMRMDRGSCEEATMEVFPPCLVELEDGDSEAMRTVLLAR